MGGIGGIPVPGFVGPIDPLPGPSDGGGDSPPSGGAVLFQLDKQTIDDLLAMLPKTWMDPVVANNYMREFPSLMGLDAITATDKGKEQLLGMSEGSIILSMLDNWIKSGDEQAQAFRENIKKMDTNPVVAALEAYIESRDNISKMVAEGMVAAGIAAAIKSATTNIAPGVEDNEKVDAKDKIQGEATGEVVRTDVYQTLQFLRNSPLILASLKAVDPEILAKAYHIAEGELVTNFLTSMATVQAKQRELIKEHLNKAEIDLANKIVKKMDVDFTDKLDVDPAFISYQMIANYIQDVKAGKETLNPLAISIAIAGIAAGSEARVPLTLDINTGAVSLDLKKDSVLAFGAPVIAELVASFARSADQTVPGLSLNVQNQVTVTFAQIALDVTIAAAYWSIPGALTLSGSMPSEGGKGPTKAAVLSYAQTIAEFVSRPEFTTFVRNRLVIAGGESVTEEHIQKYVAMFKVVLLATALAGLDKALTGGVIIRAEDFLDLISGKTALENGDFRATLVRLIREHLGELNPKDRALMLDSLVRYFSTNPKLESLIDPSKAFLILSDPELHRKSSLEQRG